MIGRDKDSFYIGLSVKRELNKKLYTNELKDKKKIVLELIDESLKKCSLNSWSHLTKELSVSKTAFSYEFKFLGLTFVFSNQNMHILRLRLSKLTKMICSDNPITALDDLNNSFLFIKQFIKEVSGESGLPSQVEEGLDNLLSASTKFLNKNIFIYNELTPTDEVVFSILPNFSSEFYFPKRDFSFVFLENDLFYAGIIEGPFTELVEKSLYFGARPEKTYFNLDDDLDTFNADYFKNHLKSHEVSKIFIYQPNKKVKLSEELDYLVEATSYFERCDNFPKELLNSVTLRTTRVLGDSIILRGDKGELLCYNPSAGLLTNKVDIEKFLSNYISE